MSATLPGKLDQQRLTNVVAANMLLLVLPLCAFFWLFDIALFSGNQEAPTLFGLPVATGIAPIGVVAAGPLAIGVITFGGFGIVAFNGIGVISFGGGGVGIIAIGGAACGVIAIGGAALGYVAIGGGALGVYVLARGGKGRHVFDRRRQDPEAVAFFRKYVPRLRTAFTA